MWPFNRKKKELPPPPQPEVWDGGSAVAERLNYFLSQQNDTFLEAVNQGNGELEVVFDKVGSARVQATLLPDGTTHFQWGEWAPYDQYKGKRPDETLAPDLEQSTSLVISTSQVEQSARSLIFVIDDDGNSVLVWPTDRMPTESDVARMKSDPSFPKIPVGIGRRPQVFMYYWSSRQK